MIRFDIVVATKGRSELFWEGFSNIVNFDRKRDRIIVFDCSDDYAGEARKNFAYLNEIAPGINFLFFTREDAVRNPGCIMDYARCLAHGGLEKPKYCLQIQDHYLNREKFVLDDTIPDGFVWDLDAVEKRMEGGNRVTFGTRKGVLIISSVDEFYCGEDYVHPDRDDEVFFRDIDRPDDKYFEIINTVCHGLKELDGGVDIGLAVDGINFCADPTPLIDFYKNNQAMCLNTIGDYGDSYVWEGRIGKIYSDAGYEFHDLVRDVVSKSPADVRAHGEFGKDWFYFYPPPLYAVFHGKDMWKHEFKLSAPYFRYAQYLAEYRKNRKRAPFMRQVFFEPA